MAATKQQYYQERGIIPKSMGMVEMKRQPEAVRNAVEDAVWAEAASHDIVCRLLHISSVETEAPAHGWLNDQVIYNLIAAGHNVGVLYRTQADKLAGKEPPPAPPTPDEPAPAPARMAQNISATYPTPPTNADGTPAVPAISDAGIGMPSDQQQDLSPGATAPLALPQPANSAPPADITPPSPAPDGSGS